MSRARTHAIVVAAVLIALGLVARVDAQRRARARPPPRRRRAAASGRADRSHRLLGVDRHAGLALAHGDAAQRRLRASPLTPEGREGCRRLGSGEGRSRRRAMRVLRRARADERAGTAAHHVAGRQHAEGRDRRGHADAALALRRRHRRRADAPRTWQGVSDAQWLTPRPNVPLQLRPAERTADAPAVVPTGGSLRVVTTNLRAGYLRKNGVPYSENAVLTEHWDLYKRPNGEEWLTITTQVEDPQYLRTARLVAPVFKKEPNGAKWDPTPCSSQMVVHDDVS